AGCGKGDSQQYAGCCPHRLFSATHNLVPCLSEQLPHLLAKSGDLVRVSKPDEGAVAVRGKPPCGFDFQSHIIREVPGEGRSQIMRGMPKREMVYVAKASVEFESHSEVLRTERALLRGSGQGQRAACGHGISEFPGASSEILFRDEVFRDIPALE